MSSKSVDLADSIVGLLNDADNAPDGGWVMNFEAQRKAAPLTVEEAERLTTLKVFVFAGAISTERRAQRGNGTFKHTYKPLVSIVRKLDGGSEDTNLEIVNQGHELVAQMESVLGAVELVSLHFISFEEGQSREPYNPEAMAALNVFVTSITLEYSD